ncbi:MAG: uroporphyrinogen decarboxylase [Rhodospirillales bacterium]
MHDTGTIKPILRALRGEVQNVPPVWLMRQAGRYLAEYKTVRSRAPNFLEFCYSPDLAIEVTLQPIEKFGFDAAILFSDILVIPDGLGQSVRFEEGVGPILEPLRSIDEIEALDTGRAADHLQPVMRSVSGIKKALDDRTALIGFAGAPWTVALYMVEGRSGSEGETLRRWSYEDPAAIDRLMDKLVKATTRYLIDQIDHGAEVVQLFDSWAGLVADGFFTRWITGPTRRIVDGIRDVHPGVPVIGFPRNAGPRIEDYVRDTGVDGVGLDAGVPLGWARERLQTVAALQGNLDNQLAVVGGDAMDSAIDRICETWGKGPFIFNLGHGIVPDTPPENVARLVERVRMTRPAG